MSRNNQLFKGAFAGVRPARATRPFQPIDCPLCGATITKPRDVDKHGGAWNQCDGRERVEELESNEW